VAAYVCILMVFVTISYVNYYNNHRLNDKSLIMSWDFVMKEKSELEQGIAQLIVDTLNLDEISAEEIDLDQPLFNEGLGLDSIDALELALAITKRFGCKLTSDDEENANVFSSLRTLSHYVENNRC